MGTLTNFNKSFLGSKHEKSMIKVGPKIVRLRDRANSEKLNFF